MLICAPVTSRSGYGDHSRDLVNSLFEMDMFNIKILDVPWGQCPRNALDNNIESNNIIKQAILTEPKLDNQPDVYIDIRIPNEFQQFGKFNIGITAGIETDIISPEWIEGCNKMDLIIVPSEHSKRGLINTLYDQVKNLPDGSQQKTGEHKIDKPVEVLFEGFDETTYKKIEIEKIQKEKIYQDIDNLQDDFLFLHLGQWTTGDYGDDRKNISTTIKIFCEAFANKKKKPGLLLKTNGAGFSVLDHEDTKLKIKAIKKHFPKNFDLPNIYLLHGELTNDEINILYNHPKVKCMLSLTHGEGFGRPLLEASVTGLPIITTGWSGHIDFLNEEKCILLPGELKQVPKSVVWDKIIVENSKWFNVNESQAYHAMNYMFKNHFDSKVRAKSLMQENNDKFSLSKMTKKFKKILEKHLANQPSVTTLQLPKLKKVNQSKPINKIKLPKLKKVTS